MLSQGVRLLQKLDKKKRKYIIITTKIINGDRLIDRERPAPSVCHAPHRFHRSVLDTPAAYIPGMGSPPAKIVPGPRLHEDRFALLAMLRLCHGVPDRANSGGGAEAVGGGDCSSIYTTVSSTAVDRRNRDGGPGVPK